MIDQEEIHHQCFSDDPKERIKALEQLEGNFSLLLDKQQAWEDLHKLTNDEDKNVSYWTASALGSAFSHVPDKQQAWNDLHRLITDQDNFMRFIAVDALGSAFSHIPDKQQAWDELIELLTDGDIDVEYSAASALSSAFPHVSDKQQAWNDLIKLTIDEDYAGFFLTHSLGKVSIFKASQAEKEEDYKKELEKAIEFFKKEQESHSLWSEWGNPSQFCLPFYRSFYTIIFKKQGAGELDKYLTEAKYAIEGSKSKKLLFEAVNNLANALKEVQNIGNLDLEAKKDQLNFYRKYFDRAEELMRYTEKTAPFATITMRKGLPILDRNLKGLIEEIHKKTEIIHEQTKGTPFEELGDELNRSGLSLLQVRDLVGFKKQVQNLENKLTAMCFKLPEGQKGEACELLKMAREEHSIEDKIPLINDILSKFSYQLDIMSYLNRIDENLSSVNKKVDALIIISRPGISEEVVISTGFQLAGSGVQHSITIPLQEISYTELQEDLERIRGKTIDKLSKLPDRLAKKVKRYLLLNEKDEILEKLT